MTDPQPNPPPDRDADLINQARRQWEGVSPDPGPSPPADLPPPETFPGYDVVREIHRGGQGAVYLAIQRTTRRKVALKVMHGGPHIGSAGRARFEREVQILGQLEHPNIVRIHDSGTTADGSFFYVMDYVSGRTLDEHVNAAKPGIPDVLRLFGKICDGVNAAHLKGVIHRDLKPANVRVDARGEPVIVDFGLAKVAVPDVTEETRPHLMSMTGQFIGSLPWASPEQAEGNPALIDVRTDVYSLGVMLYQMLTGRFPYEVVGAMRDVLDNILRAAPARPSTVRRQINDEVETIVLKCLSKERERRYQSAGDIGRDIRRYLAGEPIEAKRDSGWYVLSKTMRRYRVPAGVAGAFLLVLIGSGVTIAVLNQARREARLQASTRDAEARAAEADRESARARADAEAARAQTASAVTARVLDFLKGVFEAARPGAGRAGVLVEDVLDAAAARAERELADQPDVAMELHEQMGSTYVALRALAKARPHLERAVALRRERSGESAVATLRAANALAACYRGLEMLDRAEAEFERIAAGLSAMPGMGPKHPNTLAVRFNLARALDAQRDPAKRARAVETYTALIADLRGIEKQEGLLANALTSLADLLITLERPGEAIGPLDEALALAAAHPGTVPAQTAPRAHLSRGRALAAASASDAEADAAFNAAIDGFRALFREDSPELLVARHRRADYLRARGRLDEAESEYRSIVGALDALVAAGTIGADDPLIRQMQWQYADLLAARGRFAEAAPLLEASYAMYMQKKPDGEGARETRRLLFRVYTELGDPARAGAFKEPP